MQKQTIEKLIHSMTNDTNSNIKKIKDTFKNLNYVDDSNKGILHIFCDEFYDEEKCFLAIKSLLEAGLNPNGVDEFGYNFIQLALYTKGYGQNFIIKITKEAVKYGLDLKHVDSDGDTILHTAIYSDDFVDSIVDFYNYLANIDFDFNIVDKENRTIIGATNYQLTENNCAEKGKSLTEFKKILDKNIMENIVRKNDGNFNSNSSNVSEKEEIFKPNLSSQLIKKLEEFGYIRSIEDYNNSIAIGREQEIEDLIIVLAEDKKSPILVGESGVGKTAIVEELLYRIQHNKVPKFLKNQIILEINPNELNAGCNYTGSLEERIKEVMHLCIENNIIIFIDEIHTMYGVGTSSKNNNDFASQLRFYLDKFHIKVIGTTTKDEYEKYFSNSAIKRRFERVSIEEPSKENLYLILEKVVIDYTIKNNIFLDSVEDKKRELFKILIQATDKNNRIYNDNLNNPDLLISIIDKAYAYAKISDATTIEIEHFIKALSTCERLGSISKSKSIARLRSLENKKEESTIKIIKFPQH